MKDMLKELPPIFEVRKENRKCVNRFLNLNQGLVGFLESLVPRLENTVSKIYKINLKMVDKSCSYRYMLALNISVSSREDSKKLIEFEDNLYDTDNHDLVDIVLFFPEVVK